MIADAPSPPCESAYVPPGLLLQWHITERCNLRCAHCYQPERTIDELSFDALLEILHQYEDLLASWRNRMPGCGPAGHITVTGGEPLVRGDLFDLLERLHNRRRAFSFALLTNGTLVDANVARRLRRLSPTFVQVSIDGGRATHDRIRGEGSFDQAVNALRCLKRHRLRTFVSFTAHRGNFRDFPQVVQVGRELGVTRVWADRLIPEGRGTALGSQVLTPVETREFFEIMRCERIGSGKRRKRRTEISMHRAVQFLVAGGRPYHCTAGDSLIAVQPDGDLYPCRRMPIRVGNLMKTPLVDLYYSSPVLRALRAPDTVIRGCEGCLYRTFCRGGLRCLSHALNGDPLTADPGCWLGQLGRCQDSGGEQNADSDTLRPALQLDRCSACPVPWSR